MTLKSLKAYRNFIVWKYEKAKDSDKLTKAPYSALDGFRVGTTETYRDRWATYEEAAAVLRGGKGFNGAGFVFRRLAKGTDICGIDIDHQDLGGEFVKGIVAMFPNAYIERSPSGEGLHLVMLVDAARVPQTAAKDGQKLDARYYSKNPNNGLEAYVAGLTHRYFTFTGDAVQDGGDVDHTDEFLRFLNAYMLKSSFHKESARSGNTSSTQIEESKPNRDKDQGERPVDIDGKVLSDDEIIAKARKAANGKKFISLYDEGDISAYASHSNADSALCSMLAFYCDGDAETMDRLFRQSKLYREKWEREDYSRTTIEKAVELCGGKFYNAKKPAFIVYDPGIKALRVVPTLLAKHFRDNQRYIFAKDSANGGVNRFVYKDGYYQLYNDAMFKGVVKGYVTEYDETLVRMGDVNEVFQNLATNLNFAAYEDMNADENIINFKNGLLRLSDMKLLPHTPDVLSTIQIPCAWPGKPMPTPMLDKFLPVLTDGDAGVANLILEFMGASLSNVKCWRMKRALFMVGDGDTGKSQLKSLVERLLGRENFTSIDLRELEARFGTGNLYNKRLAGSSDMSFLTVTELKVFKRATGGDELFAEFKGQNGFHYVYNGLLWFCMNRLPKFGGDDGQWVYDRIMQVTCPNVIPKDRQDKRLLDKLYAERDGIVYKSVMALRRVIANGYRFSEPPSVLQARKDYRSENNSAIAFWNECVAERPKGRLADGCTTGKVYDVYKAWCGDNNHGYAKTAREFRTEICGLLGVKDFNELTVRRANGVFLKGYTLSCEAKQTYSRAYGWEDIPPFGAEI